MRSPSASARSPTLVTSTRPVPVAASCLLFALTGFLAWQYAMPAQFESSFLLNHAGVEHFRDGLGLPHVAMALGPYRAGFRAWLGAIWGAYFVMVLAGAMGAPLPRRRSLLAVVVGVALVTAVLWPPSFSCDVYGYVGYARMQVLHGLNPYATTQKALIDLGDPTGMFLRWNIASPYGPLWTSLSVAVVWLWRGASLLTQVIAMKMFAAAALVGAAWGGRRVAERLAPGRGDLTLMAIGLNPLFVIEGAGNGHNDLVMMALLVAGLGAALEGRTRRAVLWAGVAGAIKFLPLLLVPWIVLAEWRARPRPWRSKARDGLGHALLAILPIAVGYWPYWAGARTLLGLQQRWHSGQTTSVFTNLSLWTQGGALLLTYAASTAWLLRGDRVRLLTAWVIMTTAIFMVATGIWLPWYLSWIWLVALLRWDTRSMTCSYLAFCFAVVLTVRYSVPSGG
jgi:hypothetical protein